MRLNVRKPERRMGEMKKADRLLLVIAACRELPCELAVSVVGSVSYTAALVTKLKKAGFIGCRHLDGKKGYVLYQRGRDYLMEQHPDRISPWLEEGGFVLPKTESDKRERLYRMAYASLFFYQQGVDTFPGEFPIHTGAFHPEVVQGYYSSFLVKRRLAKEAGGSRCCGVLVFKESSFCVYHTMESLMRWSKRTEWVFKSRTEQALYGSLGADRVQALILGKNMSMLVRMLQSDGGIKRQLFCPDDVYERYYFLPDKPEAGLQLYLLLQPEKQSLLECRLEEILGITPIGFIKNQDLVCRGIDREGCPVYFAWMTELWMLRRITDRIQREHCGKVICFSYQTAVLKELLKESAQVLGLDTNKVRNLMKTE